MTTPVEVTLEQCGNSVDELDQMDAAKLWRAVAVLREHEDLQVATDLLRDRAKLLDKPLPCFGDYVRNITCCLCCGLGPACEGETKGGGMVADRR